MTHDVRHAPVLLRDALGPGHALQQLPAAAAPRLPHHQGCQEAEHEDLQEEEDRENFVR